METQWNALRRSCQQRWADRGLTASVHWPEFAHRLDAEFETFASLLWSLYADRPDFAHHVEGVVERLFRLFEARPEALKHRDRARTSGSGWFLSGTQVGAVGYVDRFAQTFRGLERRIPYLKELGVTYLHLMPFYLSPEGQSDGGYAVSSYRDTDPKLGTMADFEHLVQAMAQEGITVVADFVFNHTSDEHPWARAARAGQPEFQDYYWMFDTRDETAPWQAPLRDIFPEVRKGSFTFFDDVNKWVWTTFNSFQWDLNYRNPAVFGAMAGEMVGLANRGVGVLRLDAVAFVWKELGTNCENRPGAHTVIQAFQSAARLTCPSLVFKSEAIVHPDDIARYIGPHECQLSYNPLLMAELWEAAATKQTALLAYSLAHRHALPAGTSWVNYVRCHDDIGWTFADEDASVLGIKGDDHRQFLNRFYTGDFPGTFARGVGFQYNPVNGDRRICGSAASLVGLERARVEHLADDRETALNRLILLYTVAYTAGGVPLLYLGDEVAVENDYTYQNNPAEAGDSRWVHRPRWSDDLAAQRKDPSTNAGRVFAALVHLAQLRKQYPILGVQGLTVRNFGHPAILGYEKALGDQRVTLVGNFSEGLVDVEAVGGTDLLSGRTLAGRFRLAPCDVVLVLWSTEVR